MASAFLTNLLTVFLGSGAAFAALEIFAKWRRETRDRKNAVEYLALQLAFLLEGYAIQCADEANDHQTAIESGGYGGKLLARLPNPPSYPESDAYKLLSRTTLADVLDFPQRCSMASKATDFWRDIVGDQDCWRVALEENTVRMGGRAIEIATSLRDEYRLPSRDLKYDTWRISQFFNDELKKIEARERKKELSMGKNNNSV